MFWSKIALSSQYRKPDKILQPNVVVPVPPVPALRDAPATPRRKRFWPWGLAVAISALIGFFAYAQFWMERVPVVAVEIASLEPVTRVLGVNGRIAAVHSVDVRSQVTGSIAVIDVSEGMSVEIDQTLVQISSQAQNAVVRQAIAGLDGALVSQQQAHQDYARAVSLGGNIPRTALAASASALQSADQEVARQTAILDQARIILETYTVRAPITGRVLSLEAEVGQIVTAATPLLMLIDVSDVIVVADVDESYAAQILLNQPTVLQLASEDMTRAGRVSFVSTRVDVDTGGLAIKLAFDAPITAPIGLTVTANIVVDARDAALTIPRTAMVQAQGGLGVFVVQDGTAMLRPVSVIEWPAARLIVTAGLAVGDAMIIDAAGIVDGQAVSVDLQ